MGGLEEFKEVMQYLKGIGFCVGIMFAGAFGAFVSISKNKNMTVTVRVTTVICGGIIANYITPLAIDLLTLGENTSHAAGFIIGYSGLKSIEYIIELIEKKVKDYTER